MNITGDAVTSVGSNTLAVFGVALTSAGMAMCCSKFCHYVYGEDQDIKKTASAIIRLCAFPLGVVAGFYVLQKTNVRTMDLDHNFISVHALHVLTALYCSAIAYLVSFSPNKSSTVLHAGLAGLMVSTPFVARLGQSALIPALGIGAAVGSYL